MSQTDGRRTDDLEQPSALGDFVRGNRDQILHAWEQEISKLPVANTLNRPALIDHIPDVLERVADIADALSRGTALTLPGELAEMHAIERLDEGFDLSQVVTEFAVLRDSIMLLWEASASNSAHFAEVRALNRAFDNAVSASVGRFTRARDRTLLALDRVATEALESRNLDDLLQRLLKVFVETTASVDTAAILIREGDRLCMRASLGLEEQVRSGFTLQVGEGFVGRIAAERKPFALTNASQDPLVRSEVLRERGVRALYGLPLVDGGEVIGVAYMGSLTAHEFSLQDKRLLGAMATRATAAIFQQVLRERAERSAAELAEVVNNQRFLANASSVLASSLDTTQTLQHLARLAVPDLADWCVVDVLEGEKLRRLAITHSDLTKVQLAQQWSQRFPPEPERPPGIAHALRTGEAVFYPDVTDELIARSKPDPEYLQLLRALGIRSCIVAPLSARGRSLGTITLIHAESGRHYTTAELDTAVELGRRAGLALDNARLYREAQDAIRVRDEMVAIVSHDLRNPLSAIKLGVAAALQSGDVGPHARKHLDVVERSAERMERLIRDLLDTASLQVGRFTLAIRPEEVSSVLAEVVDAHKEIAKSNAITITRDFEIDGTYVYCDRDRLIQAVGNLLGNAIKFCRQGDTVIVRARVEEGQLRLAIQDTGPGIPPDELPHIFEPYWSAKRDVDNGMGLGLYICTGIIEAHGGSIDVESRVGEGTTFSITLPIAPGPTARGGS